MEALLAVLLLRKQEGPQSATGHQSATGVAAAPPDDAAAKKKDKKKAKGSGEPAFTPLARLKLPSALPLPAVGSKHRSFERCNVCKAVNNSSDA